MGPEPSIEFCLRTERISLIPREPHESTYHLESTDIAARARDVHDCQCRDDRDGRGRGECSGGLCRAPATPLVFTDNVLIGTSTTFSASPGVLHVVERNTW